MGTNGTEMEMKIRLKTGLSITALNKYHPFTHSSVISLFDCRCGCNIFLTRTPGESSHVWRKFTTDRPFPWFRSSTSITGDWRRNAGGRAVGITEGPYAELQFNERILSFRI